MLGEGMIDAGQPGGKRCAVGLVEGLHKNLDETIYCSRKRILSFPLTGTKTILSGQKDFEQL